MNKYLTLILGCWLSQAAAATYTVTAYCPCEKCCGHYAGGPTASGRMPQQGVTIAAPRSIAFGTWLNIEGIGKRRVDDRLATRFDNRIDVFFAKHADAVKFGRRKLKVSF